MLLALLGGLAALVLLSKSRTSNEAGDSNFVVPQNYGTGATGGLIMWPPAGTLLGTSVNGRDNYADGNGGIQVQGRAKVASAPGTEFDLTLGDKIFVWSTGSDGRYRLATNQTPVGAAVTRLGPILTDGSTNTATPTTGTSTGTIASTPAINPDLPVGASGGFTPMVQVPLPSLATVTVNVPIVTSNLSPVAVFPASQVGTFVGIKTTQSTAGGLSPSIISPTWGY